MTKNQRAKAKNRLAAAQGNQRYRRAYYNNKKDPGAAVSGGAVAARSAADSHTGWILGELSRSGLVGRTLTLLHLGAVMAAAGDNVLLVDLDSHWNLTARVGVAPNADTDTLTDSAQLLDHVRLLRSYPKGGRLSLLPGPGQIRRRRETAGEWLPALFERARAEFDVTVVDVGAAEVGSPLGDAVADNADAVITMLRFRPDMVIANRTVTYSDSYNVYRSNVLERIALLCWLTDDFLDSHPDLASIEHGTSADTAAVRTAMRALVDELSSDGRAEFGEDWDRGAAQWLRVGPLPEPLEVDLLHPNDPGAVDYVPLAGTDDLTSHYVPADSDMVIDIDWRSPADAARNILMRNDQRGYPITACRSHCGVVLTRTDETFDPERVHSLDGIVASTVPDVEDTDLIEIPDESSPLWHASVALARELGSRAGHPLR